MLADVRLVWRDPSLRALWMFVVIEAEAAAIHAAHHQGGEFAAAVELRRLSPGIRDNARARACAPTIAGWKSPKLPPRPPSDLRRAGGEYGLGSGYAFMPHSA